MVNLGLVSVAIYIVFHVIRKIAAEAYYALELKQDDCYDDESDTLASAFDFNSDA